MKKTVLAVLLLVSCLLFACSHTSGAKEILLEFCAEYPIDADVYSSLLTERDQGYVDTEMLLSLYGVEEYPTRDFALVFYGKVGTVREIGVFVTETGAERAEIIELADNRISFLSSFADGEGFVKKYGEVIVYGFVEDASYAVGLFDGLL